MIHWDNNTWYLINIRNCWFVSEKSERKNDTEIFWEDRQNLRSCQCTVLVNVFLPFNVNSITNNVEIQTTNYKTLFWYRNSKSWGTQRKNNKIIKKMNPIYWNENQKKLIYWRHYFLFISTCLCVCVCIYIFLIENKIFVFLKMSFNYWHYFVIHLIFYTNKMLKLWVDSWFNVSFLSALLLCFLPWWNFYRRIYSAKIIHCGSHVLCFYFFWYMEADF